LLRTVCIVSDKAFISGGQAKVAIDTACLLSRRGFRVIFFAAVGPVDPSLAEAGVEVECLGQPDILANENRAAAATSGLWNRPAAKALEAVTRGLDPATSILHCHGFAKALSPAIGPVLDRTQVPCLFTMHEYFLLCPNGAFFDFRKQEICRRRPLGLDCLTTNCDSRKPAHKLWRVVRQAATWGPGRMPRGLRDIAYISKVQLTAVRRYLPEEARLHHLPNPVATPKDGRLANPREASAFLFVGRFSPEKGGRIFAEAARIARVPAVFVGDGAERAAISEANPDAGITGWKSPDEVRELMLGARALVFPSLWYETFGLVAYEALALGLPVVAGGWTAAAEAVIPGSNGLILDRMDAATLARALTDLSRDDHAIFDEIRKPENRAAPSEDAYIERLLEIYRDVQASRRQVAPAEKILTQSAHPPSA
jgi:glycosyltransferase involved in cell wall biosynthesis